MVSPSVSILIPAYRARWLDLAIASALAQTHSDFELLIGDDCADNSVESVVAKWQDPRLRYYRNPMPRVAGANRDYLLSLARGEYIKFLFDDDFLLPSSIEVLLTAARSSGCRIAFHSRYVVDEDGVVIDSPQCVYGDRPTIVAPEIFFDQSIAAETNIIGEPSNILIHADTLRGIESPFALDGNRMRFLTDMALYTNFARMKYGFVGVSKFLSAFRRHGGQTSNSVRYNFSAGIFEWEFLRRWSVDAGLLLPAQFDRGTENQLGLYRAWVRRCPELGLFMALGGKTEGPNYLSPRFKKAMAQAYATIETRRTTRGSLRPGLARLRCGIRLPWRRHGATVGKART
jgi:glycosyltransferase involved in cell wall biosynthesis